MEYAVRYRGSSVKKLKIRDFQLQVCETLTCFAKLADVIHVISGEWKDDDY